MRRVCASGEVIPDGAVTREGRSDDRADPGRLGQPARGRERQRDDDSLTVTVNLPLWWKVIVSKPVVDPDEPFTGDEVKRLADAAIAAARVLLMRDRDVWLALIVGLVLGGAYVGLLWLLMLPYASR